ncbi:MAG: YitT family protein [Mucinivorans sp.]
MTLKVQLSEQIKQWVYILLGSMIMSVAFVMFINPYNIVPGGVYGIGIVLHYLFPEVAVGTFGLCLDIPLLITSMLVFGSKVGLKTLFAAVMTPLMMNGLTLLVGNNPETMLGGVINLSHDILLACLFGGVLLGLSMGLILKTHATSGGTDIVGMIVSKFMHLPIARSVLMVDSSVVLFGLLVFGNWIMPLYSLITIFVSTKMMDFVLEGGSNDKLLFILSDKHELIRKFILEDMERGGTYIKSAGMYNNTPREMIFVVISRREMSRIQDFIRSIDPSAFMIVVNAHETLGDGFKQFTEKIGG